MAGAAAKAHGLKHEAGSCFGAPAYKHDEHGERETGPGGNLVSANSGKTKWIQKAINPKHEGYCTPMTKKTCTPRRKALAMRFKHGDLSK